MKKKDKIYNKKKQIYNKKTTFQAIFQRLIEILIE